MSKIDLLLDGELDRGNIKLNVNEHTRTITYEGNELILGVEGDYRAEKVYLYFPINLTENFNIKSQNVKVFITYENADGEMRIHKCNREDALSSEDYVTYSWILSSRVTAYQGKVKFMVCAKQYSESGDVISNEWHSAICEGTVLDGLHAVDNYTTELYPDLVASISDFDDKVETIKEMFSSITGGTYDLEQMYKALELKADADHAHMSTGIAHETDEGSTIMSVGEALDELYSTTNRLDTTLAGLTGDFGDIEFYTKTEVDGFLTGKSNTDHVHDTDEIGYTQTKSLSDVLEDIYDQMEVKADEIHTHQAADVYWYNAPITTTFTSFTNQLNNKANISYVDETFAKKEDYALYEHNITVIGGAGTHSMANSISSMILNVKAYSNRNTIVSNYSTFTVITGLSDTYAVSNYRLPVNGVIRFTSDTKAVNIITGLSAEAAVSYNPKSIDVFYINSNNNDNKYVDKYASYLGSSDCTYYDYVRQII